MKKALSLLLITVLLISACSKKNTPNPTPANSTVTVSTLAGSGFAGSTNGTGINASFNNPYGLAVDASGNVFVADRGNNLIRKITPSGTVTTFATLAFNAGPEQLAFDSSDNLYVANWTSESIQKITPAGVVNTFFNCASVWNFGYPGGLAVDASGNVFATSAANSVLFKITPAGAISTVDGNVGFGGGDMTFDVSGNLYLVCNETNFIQEVNPAGQIAIYAGSGNASNTISKSGPKSEATFVAPSGITIDATGNIYVTQLYNNLIRKISVNGTVSTLAGNGQQGSVNGIASNASFNNPSAIAVDASGNLYVADSGNNLIRKIAIN